MLDILQIGKWLEFEAGTCFGNTKRHFGILMGIDKERNVAVVAVNATSQWDKLIRFADLHGIPEQDALVDVTNDIHFTKPTAIDCHRPQEIPLDKLAQWYAQDLVCLAAYNIDVNRDTVRAIAGIISRSPLVEDRIKLIVKNSTADYFAY